jgi:hypothetical protein
MKIAVMGAVGRYYGGMLAADSSLPLETIA